MRVNGGQGYYQLFEPTHPLANKSGYVLEHRKIAWDAKLITNPSLQVHHINGVKDDNRIENLEIITASEHTTLHTKGSHRPRRDRSPCVECGVLTGSGYGLCTKHYKAVWQRKNKYKLMINGSTAGKSITIAQISNIMRDNPVINTRV